MKIPNHLLPAKLRLAEHGHANYYHDAAPGVTLDDVLNPNYWENVAERMKLGDRIEVLAADYSFDLDLRVVGIDPRGHWAQVVERGKAAPHTTSRSPAPDAKGLVAEHDPVQGWRVFQGRDLIAKGLPDEAAANAKIAELRGEKPAKVR